MDREAMLNSMMEAMTSPWSQQLLMDLMARQPSSIAQVEQLKARSMNTPVLWPFHAVQLPVAIDHAAGSRVTDVDGNDYLDLFLGFGTQALFGHNPPDVVDRVRGELGRTVGNGYFHPVELELTERLHRFTGHEAFVFGHTGTGATDAAIRLCRAHTGRRMVAKLESATHGTHDWGVQSSVALMHGHPITPWPERHPEGVQAIPFARGVAPATRDDLLILPHDVDRAIDLLRRHKDEVACVITESCNISFPFAERGAAFAKQLVAACRELGILSILDEVQTGFRWGPGGANRTEDIGADLCTYGKVLSGLGIPLSAVGGPAEVLRTAQTEGINTLDYGAKTTMMTTHQGNHLALLASAASLAKLEAEGEGWYQRTRAKKARLHAVVDRLQADGIPLHLVGYGDFIGTFLFVHDPHGAADPRDLATRAEPAATILLSLGLRREGIYTYSWPFVFLGDAYSDADITRIGETVDRVARDLHAAGLPAPRSQAA